MTWRLNSIAGAKAASSNKNTKTNLTDNNFTKY
jgi:hypothetical protein